MNQSHLITSQTSSSSFSLNNNSNGGGTVWPGMCLTGWVEICYVAVGPFFTQSTDCVVRASRCKTEWDFQFAVCTLLWWDVNGVHNQTYLEPWPLYRECSGSLAGSGHSLCYYSRNQSHTHTLRPPELYSPLLSSGCYLKESKRVFEEGSFLCCEVSHIFLYVKVVCVCVSDIGYFWGPHL